MAVHLDPTLSSIVACYLNTHGLRKTLSIFLLETKSEFPLQVDIVSLETLYDIYLSTQTSVSSKKQKKQEDNVLKPCEMEGDTKLEKGKLQMEETVVQDQKPKKKEKKKAKIFFKEEALEEIPGQNISDELRNGQEDQGNPDVGDTQDAGGKKTKHQKKELIHMQEQMKKEKEISVSEISQKMLGIDAGQVAELKSKKVVESPYQVSPSTAENKEGMKACSVHEGKFNHEDISEKREKHKKKRKMNEMQETMEQCDKVKHEGELKPVKGVPITNELYSTSVEVQGAPTVDHNGNLKNKKSSGSESMLEQGDKTGDDKFAFDSRKNSHGMHGERLKIETSRNMREKKSKKKGNHVVELEPLYFANVKEDALLEHGSADQKVVLMKDSNQCLIGVVQREDVKENEEPVNHPSFEKSRDKSKKKKKNEREVNEQSDAKDCSFERKAISIENIVCKDNGVMENESPLKDIDKERLDVANAFQNGSKTREKKKGAGTDTKMRTGLLAFRRVDPDKVEFSDPRLQDNSYWAKKRAEEGYGAKAQEVLGQVRGKNFRHEKIKKKRGSYKGGSIDMHSNSIKFKYADDDE